MHERIVEVRHSMKLSQAKFGEKLGVSRDVISNLENNRVQPKQLFIDHFCNKLNVNKEWLLTGTGAMYSMPSEEIELMNTLADICESPNIILKDIVNKLILLDDEYLNLVNHLVDTLSKSKKNSD